MIEPGEGGEGGELAIGSTGSSENDVFSLLIAT